MAIDQDLIEDLLNKPKSISGDQGSVTYHSPSEAIKALEATQRLGINTKKLMRGVARACYAFTYAPPAGRKDTALGAYRFNAGAATPAPAPVVLDVLVDRFTLTPADVAAGGVTLTGAPTAIENVKVFVDNLQAEIFPSSGFTLAGNVITFNPAEWGASSSTPLMPGDQVTVRYF